jgi:hypothetical protein
VGSAVLWRDRTFEVVHHRVTSGSEAWVLDPWPETEAMRTVFSLRTETIAELAGETDRDRKNRRMRAAIVPAVPLMGLAPAPLQRRWHREIGFPAIQATALSAVAEVGLGVVGVVQALAGGIGGAVFLPPYLMWLTVVGPVLMAVGLVRLASALGHDEPLGSPLGVPWLLVSGRDRRPVEEPVRPTIVRRSHDGGVDLRSPIHRNDWPIDGVLGYRGELFVLTGCRREGDSWVYRFDPADSDAVVPTLRLTPPKSAQTDNVGRPPNVLATALITVVACLSSSEAQRAWADRIDVRPVWLTLIGGAAELIGGLHNLAAGGGDLSALGLLLNLVLVGDGSVRLALLTLSQEPVGSVFGVLLRPLTLRLIPHDHRAG